MLKERNLPLGPTGIPFLGLLQEVKANFADFLLNSTRTYGDVFTFKIGLRRAFFFNHPDTVREILQNWELYRKSPVNKDTRQVGLGNFLGQGLLTNDGAPWKQQRKLMQPAFHFKYINNYAETMIDYTQTTIAQWSQKSAVDIEQEMMQLTLNIATKTLFDTEVGDYSELGQALIDVQRESIKYTQLPFDIPSWLPISLNTERKRLNHIIDETVFGIIQERKASGQIDHGDLLSMLMLARDEDGNAMDEQQLRDEIITLFIAGHETTALTISWMFYLLAQYPDVQQRLYAEIQEKLGNRRITLDDLKQLPYLKMVLDETLRLYPVGWLFPRFAAENTQLAGYDITANDMVLASPYVLHRDSRWFNQPEHFDPERFNGSNKEKIEKYTYLPFGGGPRVCIGNSFALMEAQLICATIAQHYRLTLVPDQKIEIEPLVTMRPKHGIRMELRTAKN